MRAFNYGGGTVTPIGKINFYAYRHAPPDAWSARATSMAMLDILTGAGPGSVFFGPHVRGFNFDNASRPWPRCRSSPTRRSSTE
ncbi:MAG: hypothetical protein U0166_03715 [Acidobacteriota bacterium]